MSLSDALQLASAAVIGHIFITLYKFHMNFQMWTAPLPWHYFVRLMKNMTHLVFAVLPCTAIPCPALPYDPIWTLFDQIGLPYAHPCCRLPTYDHWFRFSSDAAPVDKTLLRLADLEYVIHVQYPLTSSI